MSLPPAGWYPDPGGGPGRRYWDGQAWTEHVEELPPPAAGAAPGVSPAPAGAGDGPNTALIACGYVFAVLIPLVGFILGIVVATRPAKATSRHGVWIIVASVVAFVFWLVVFGAGTAGP